MENNQSNIFLMQIYQKAQIKAFNELEKELLLKKDWTGLKELQEEKEESSIE